LVKPAFLHSSIPTDDFNIEENTWVKPAFLHSSIPTDDFNIEENTWVKPAVLHPSIPTDDFNIEENTWVTPAVLHPSIPTDDFNIEENTWVNPAVLHPSQQQKISGIFQICTSGSWETYNKGRCFAKHLCPIDVSGGGRIGSCCRQAYERIQRI
jgi:hypothetical protein